MKKILIILLYVVSLSICKAQGWIKIYGSIDYQDRASCIRELSDGGFIVGGWTHGTDSAFEKPGNYILRLDSKGAKLWEYALNTSVYTQTHDIVPTQDGGFLASSSYAGYAFLIKLDSNGNEVWQKSPSAPFLPLYGTSIVQADDGGFVFTGSVNYGSGNLDAYIYKVDANGDSIWYTTIGDTYYQNGIKILKTDNGYVICGEYTDSLNKALIAKVDLNGNLLWQKIYGNNVSAAQSISQDVAGNFFICGSVLGDSTQNLYVMKLDQNGDSIWYKDFIRTETNQGRDIEVKPNGEIVVLCNSINALLDAEIVTLNANGALISSFFYGGLASEYVYSLTLTKDGGVAFAGRTYSYGFSDGQLFIVKTDAQGNAFSNYISGKVFADNNTNCVIDNLEEGLHQTGNQHWLVKVVPGPFGNDAYYTTTTINGTYEIPCDTGSYVVSAIPVNELWSATCSNANVHFSSYQQVAENTNFGFIVNKNCSKLTVDISSTRLRACRDATYYVNYCNNGTKDESNALIKLDLPSYFNVNSSSLPWDSISGNSYFYKLNTVAQGHCGKFTISGSISCDVLLGQTLCATSHISPKSECEEPSMFWDRSSSVVSGICNDTAICFSITNTGSAMQGTAQWRLFSNNELAQTGAFQLGAGATREFCFEPNGTTLRFEVNQRPNHPGNSNPRASIELCGVNNNAVGYILQVPQDDLDENKEISCAEITGSFDPNDKTVVPKGFTENKYIRKTDELEYTIRFQNTGNDTAFLVRIVDSLDLNVYDINTIKTLSSSHSYKFEISYMGIAEWKFNNILLPDSFTNEDKSHGFVKFKINQKNNAKGTVIKNNALIYFDYNEPVITNYATNMVYDTVITTSKLIQLNTPTTYIENIEIAVFPNPFTDQTTLKIQNIEKQQFTLKIIDLRGQIRSIKTNYTNLFIIQRETLENGMYFYQIENENQILATGKIIIE